MKVFEAREIADADQAQLRIAQLSLRKPFKQIDQLDLAEQIVFKPEHDFFVIRKRPQRLMLRAQLSFAFFKLHAIGLGEMRGPHLQKIFFREVTGRGPANEGFAPGEMFARQIRLFRSFGS